MHPFFIILRVISLIRELQVVCFLVAILVCESIIGAVSIYAKFGHVRLLLGLHECFIAPKIICLDRCQIRRRCVIGDIVALAHVLLIICVFSSPLHLLAVHRQFVLVQFLQVLDRLEKIAHVLSMVFIKQLLLRVPIRLANLSFSIEARQSVLQLLKDHHALVVLRDAPADVNLLLLRPVFDPVTNVGPDTIFQIT